MLKHQLLEILKTFSDHEKKKFGKFLCSPYFTNSPKILKLFYILKKFHPTYDNPRLTKHYIHRKLDYGLPYNDSTIRNLIYDLQEYAEKFLRQQKFESRPLDGYIYAREEYINRGLTDLFDINVINSEIKMADFEFVDIDYSFHKFKVQLDKFAFNLINNRLKNKTVIETESAKLADSITYFVNYFIVESIKGNQALLSNARKNETKNQIQFVMDFLRVFDFDKLNTFAQKYSKKASNIVESYICLLKAFLNFDNDNYYIEYKKSILKNINKLSYSDKNYLFMRLRDYCLLKQSKNKPSKINYEKELFDFYELTLKMEYYKTDSNPYLPIEFYKDILIHGLKLRKYSWVESFITGSKNKLRPENRKDMTAYATALLYYDKGKYEEALSVLKKITNDAFVYRLEAKSLELRIFIDTNQFEKAMSLIDAYKLFMSNDELITDLRKVHHGNFIHYANKLIRYRSNGKDTDANSIMKEIQNTADIINKEWLIDGFAKHLKKLKKTQ
jgi:hypothetical protein